MKVLLVLTLALAACWPTLAGLHERWTDTSQATYTHGYLVAAICAWLLWRANVGKAAQVDTGNGRRLLPFLLLAAAGLAWVLVVRAGIGLIEWALLPVILWLVVWAAFGTLTARRNLFPIGFLYFAMPVWGTVNGLFQSGTVLAVRTMLRAVGIPSHFIGNYVQIPAGTFEIAGGCSGLHFVIVALALAALMGEVRGDDWRGRARLLLLALGLAVLTNWIRVFTIIVAGHLTDMRHYLVAQSHYGFGWVLFAAAMLVFFVLERRIDVRKAQRPLPAVVPATPMHRPVVAATLIVLMVGVLQMASARPADIDALPPAVAGGWQEVARPAPWQPRIHGADAQRAAVFEHAAEPAVERLQFLFRWQRQDKELGGYGNDMTAHHVVQHSTALQLGDVPVKLHEARDAAGNSWLIAESYAVATRHYPAPFRAQLHYAAASLAQLRSAPAAILVWRTPCVPGCEQAVARLQQFIADTERGN